jgi:hypothetical protein
MGDGCDAEDFFCDNLIGGIRFGNIKALGGGVRSCFGVDNLSDCDVNYSTMSCCAEAGSTSTEQIVYRFIFDVFLYRKKNNGKLFCSDLFEKNIYF